MMQSTGLPNGSIRTWDEMTRKFLDKYFSSSKTDKFRREIHNFCQNETETTPEKIVTILDELSEDANQWPSEVAERRRMTGVHQVDSNTSVQRPQFQPQQPIHSGLEDLMKSFIVKTDERLDAHGAAIKELGTGLRSLERQVGHIATTLSERIPGTLPVETEKNPKKTVNVVTLRSRQVLKYPTPIHKETAPEKESGKELKIEDDDKKTEKKKGYAKFLKEILIKKSKIEETLLVKLTEHCSAILQNKLPQKCGDPGSFTIPCSLGTLNIDKSLYDSGASINLMPFSIYMKLKKEIGEIRSVPISLQLADQMTITPEGIVEDVLVRVDKFVFPVDFIVVNMEENREVPLILRRLFLATGRAILDIHDRKLMLRVGEETVTFEMNVATGVKKKSQVQVLSGS
ncbi:uncharacterized protein [Nicotiana tomentosiformis]|uniref:uncharacterized protein n=1 Tax=Nicotiana tomentosiformis TaxID=4098 RepID=UPI00388C5818